MIITAVVTHAYKVFPNPYKDPDLPFMYVPCLINHPNYTSTECICISNIKKKKKEG